MATLQDPIRIGDWELPNRVIMAPLTRCRASEGRVPNDLMREYYQQRASAGLIISEATSISPMGVGYPNTPGIWSKEQVAGWQRVTDGVHHAGGRRRPPRRRTNHPAIVARRSYIGPDIS